jgi:hypothetical protein
MRLGPYNLALVACYLVPAWGSEAVKALTSPYFGLVDPLQASAAVRLRDLLELGPDGVLPAASALAAFKLLVVASLVAYLIDFARTIFSERVLDRATVNVVLAFAVAAVAIWIMPALAFDGAVAREAHVAQLLMVAGALFVITVERHVEDLAAARAKAVPAGLESGGQVMAALPPHPEEGASTCAFGQRKPCVAPVSKDGAAPWFRDAAHEVAESG